MKVLMIGSDRKLFEDDSSVLLRTIEYGKKMEALHIVVFALKSSGLSEKKLSENVFVYPTNSFSKWFFVIDAISLGKKIIKEKGFVRGLSVISCQDPFESGFVGWRIARKFRLPFYLQIHTDFFSKYFKTSFLQSLRVMTARFLLPRALGVRTVSVRIVESIKKAGIKLKNNPDILPIRIDASSFNEGENIVDLKKMFPQFKFIVFSASRLSPEKRIGDAISALSQVLKSYPFLGLVVAGEGSERKKLEEKAKSLGVQDHVVFLGFRDDVFSLMKSVHMFLSTSEYEGYGMSLVEAGLAKCPVLSTNVGIAYDILVHKVNSYICPVGDINCIASGITELINNNPTRYTLAESLFQTLQEKIPTREQYVESYVKNLEKLLPDYKTRG